MTQLRQPVRIRLLLPVAFVAGALLAGHADSRGQDAPAPRPVPVAGRYLGSKSCRKCHLKEFRSWEATPMAKAFEVLAPGQKEAEKRAARLDPAVDYRKDDACLRCHVVGLGQEGGFRPGYDVAKDPERLLGVGCESCHGPGGGYVGPGKKDKDYPQQRAARRPLLERDGGYVVAPGRDVCVSCHAPASPSYRPFDFEQQKSRGLHERR